MEHFTFVTACVLFAVFGLCIGSFCNVLVYRLPRGMNLAKPASHCPHCDHKLAWYDNIPLLSFVILRGKCRYCGAPISPRYFIVELANCLLWLSAALVFYRVSVWFALVCALALSVLLVMALIDMEQMFIPDSLQIALLVRAIAGVFLDAAPWQDKLYGLLLGGGIFLLFYFLCFPLFGREGLGFGDVKLMACAGLLLGWKAVFVGIVIAIAIALVDIVMKRLTAPHYKGTLPRPDADEFAFAPYLAFGIAIALFFGNALADWYAALFIVT